MRTITILTLGLAVCVSGTASAASEAIGVVAMSRSSERDAVALEAVVQSWAIRSAKIDFYDVSDQARAKDLEAREKKASEAEEAYKRGLAEYDGMSYESSLAAIERAIELYEQTDLTRHLDGLLKSYSIRALALFYAGQVSQAKNQLTDLYTLQPTFAFEGGRLTPDIEGLVDEARSSVEQAPPTTLEVQAQPGFSKVFVDGRYLGVTPLEAKKLTPGNHFVTVLGTGKAFAQERHIAAPGQIARFKLNPAEGGRALLGRLEAIKTGVRAKKVSEPGVGLAKLAGADQALLIGVAATETSTLRVYAYRIAKDGHIQAAAETVIPNIPTKMTAKMDAFLDTVHGKDLPRGPNGSPVKVLQDAGGPFPLSYVIGGAGGAFIVGGAVMGVLASGSRSKAQSLPNIPANDGTYASHISAMKSQSLMANIFYGVGVVGLGVGGYFFYMEMKDGQPAGGAPAEGGSDPFTSIMPVPLADGGAVVIQGSF